MTSSVHPTTPRREVLLVDDDRVIRRVIERAITTLGVGVVSAADGIEALALIGATPGRFSAVVLDLSMPGMSGDEVLARLRTAAPALPVIIMTGHLHTLADLEGAAAVLTKPVGRDEIRAALAAVL